MKLHKAVIISILISFAYISSSAQEKKFSFFGSYNYGIGSITAKVSSDLYYPLADEVKKLRSGSINQFELGVFYRTFGVGFIHNVYSTDASTNYENADINKDAYFENGTLSDDLKLNYNGLELMYKIPVFSTKFDIMWKIGLGFQSYSIIKDYNLMGEYPGNIHYNLDETKFTTLAGVEINYQIWKFIGIGLETSILPGKYSKLKDKESPSFVYSDNVTRLSTGLKIKVTI